MKGRSNYAIKPPPEQSLPTSQKMPPARLIAALVGMKTGAEWIRPSNTNRLVEEVFLALEGDSVLVLEGNLGGIEIDPAFICALPAGFRTEASDAKDRVAVALALSNGKEIFRAITQDPDWKQSIGSMHVYRAGQRAFLAGDSFHDECISLWPAAPADLAQNLISAGIASYL